MCCALGNPADAVFCVVAIGFYVCPRCSRCSLVPVCACYFFCVSIVFLLRMKTRTRYFNTSPTETRQALKVRATSGSGIYNHQEKTEQK